ncbi:MAG TPA: pyridoxamine 5'-phosphate oxidase family protein [Anaerolineales bacterium]|nr:pyridoxamine 5'-phosphate oxidase family protein [Anaerolineales bacterium]HRF47983.1 pyridoxamine 5'-phosphate oxidase family protein [Anaerolineales bacterium]
MTHWSEFAEQAPELAAFGQLRFKSGVAYLATLREDGGPRVHPVTPIVGERLFLFMEPTSPKGRALRQDGRYALHCAVENSEGGGGEFWVRGRATFTDDPADRAEASASSPYEPAARYILFVLSVQEAFMKQYGPVSAVVKRWSDSGSRHLPD